LVAFAGSGVAATEFVEPLLEETPEDDAAVELEELLPKEIRSDTDDVDWTDALLVAFRVLELSEEL
jgi:hypothetical protein